MSNLTFFLAIWGSITGTIGLIISGINLYYRAVQHNRDSAKVKITTFFDYHIDYGFTKRQLVRIASLGKKPIYFDSIIYSLEPNGFFKKFTKKYYKYEQKLSNTQLLEGKKIDIKFNIPSEIELQIIKKISILDQTGKKRKIPWKFSKKYLKNYNKTEEIYKKIEENNEYIVTIIGKKISNFYYINRDVSEKNSQRKSFSYQIINNKKNYEKNIQHLENKGISELLERGIPKTK